MIYNLPSKVNDDEIKNYIITILTTLNPNQREENPIHSYTIMEDGLYYIFEFVKKDDIDLLVNLDQTDWRGYRIRV
jgi:ABC-type transport system substrate-binding protein